MKELPELGEALTGRIKMLTIAMDDIYPWAGYLL